MLVLLSKCLIHRIKSMPMYGVLRRDSGPLRYLTPRLGARGTLRGIRPLRLFTSDTRMRNSSQSRQKDQGNPTKPSSPLPLAIAPKTPTQPCLSPQPPTAPTAPQANPLPPSPTVKPAASSTTATARTKCPTAHPTKAPATPSKKSLPPYQPSKPVCAPSHRRQRLRIARRPPLGHPRNATVHESALVEALLKVKTYART